MPGPSIDKPNIYDFNTSYDFMYKDLSQKDLTLYTQNGILHMLDRNRRIKLTPERFQECKEKFDVIFTVEERIFDQVIEGFYKYIFPNMFFFLNFNSGFLKTWKAVIKKQINPCM